MKALIKCLLNSSPLSHQGLHSVSFFLFFILSCFMVLVLEKGDLLGIFGDLQSSFFLSERTPYQSSGRYERMFHRGTLPGKKKDSCLKSLTFLLRLNFERKFCYLLNKKSVRHFLFCYLLWKTFKSLSPKLLRHRYSECIKAFMVAY